MFVVEQSRVHEASSKKAIWPPRVTILKFKVGTFIKRIHLVVKEAKVKSSAIKL